MPSLRCYAVASSCFVDLRYALTILPIALSTVLQAVQRTQDFFNTVLDTAEVIVLIYINERWLLMHRTLKIAFGAAAQHTQKNRPFRRYNLRTGEADMDPSSLSQIAHNIAKDRMGLEEKHLGQAMCSGAVEVKEISPTVLVTKNLRIYMRVDCTTFVKPGTDLCLMEE